MQRAISATEEDLIRSYYFEDTTKVKQLMETHFNNNADGIMTSAGPFVCFLHIARPETMRWFLKTYTPRIRGFTNCGFSPLCWPESTPDILRVLLEHGVDPNTKNQDGTTAVMSYVGWHITSCVDMLLKYGASLRDAQEALLPYPGYVGMHGLLQTYRDRAERCKRAALTLMVLKRKRVLHPDMARVLAKLVWDTRRSDVWEKEK